jgi:hypothetical protein
MLACFIHDLYLLTYTRTPHAARTHTHTQNTKQTMSNYGYSIIQSLVVDIRVDEKVRLVFVMLFD